MDISLPGLNPSPVPEQPALNPELVANQESLDVGLNEVVEREAREDVQLRQVQEEALDVNAAPLMDAVAPVVQEVVLEEQVRMVVSGSNQVVVQQVVRRQVMISSVGPPSSSTSFRYYPVVFSTP